MHILSEIILKGDLYNSIDAALRQLEHLPSQSQAEEIYRAGFRAGLLSQAIAHGINMPQLRNAEADAQRRNRKITRHDMRL